MSGKKNLKIGVDLLGSSLSPAQILSTLGDFVPSSHSTPCQFVLFGTKDALATLEDLPHLLPFVVQEEILPEEDPLVAIRKKRNSSIVLGIDELKKGHIDAFVSAGNTGALLTAATLSLPLLPGIERPALMALIPTKKEPLAALDMGANVHLKAESFLQFAKMGIAFQKSRGIASPKVGLLNIGEEKKKGTAQARSAHQLLQTLGDAFVGNIEGRDVFCGQIDVLVTDGFTGNVFLKTAEGIAGFILDQMEDLGPIGSFPPIKSIIQRLRNRLHYAEHPGAILCGVDGNVIKCHGSADTQGFFNSIKGAIDLLENKFIEQIKSELTNPS